MKIAVCSDLHLEFHTVEIKNPGDVDVLILSGDICVAKDLSEWQPNSPVDFGKSNRYHNFFQQVASEFKHVIYVAGNHEHYHGDYKYTISDLKKRLAYLENLHVLDKETFELDDVVFVGGTLWTDMNKEDPMTLYGIAKMMNDFRCVDNSNHEVTYKVIDYAEDASGNYVRNDSGDLVVEKVHFKKRAARFTPDDAVEDHKKMLAYIKHVYSEMPPWKQMVVVGHHTPSHNSCHPKYAGDHMMNGGYHSDLSEVILERPGIVLWTHGHTHDLFDYMIGTTRVVCNPRGYFGHEELADNFKLKVIEI